jgi:DNA-binding CsgD family transcriptional regulator
MQEMPHSRGVAIIDSTGKHLWISSEIPQLRGKVIGKPVLDFVAEEDQVPARRALFRAIVEGKANRYSVRAGGEGVMHQYDCHIRPLKKAAAVVTWRIPQGHVHLTHEERHILILVCDELTNKQIGDVLGISGHAVDNKRRVIRKKIGAKGIAGEVKWAVRQGLC